MHPQSERGKKNLSPLFSRARSGFEFAMSIARTIHRSAMRAAVNVTLD